MLPVYRSLSKEQVVPSPFWPLTKTYLESGKLTLLISNCPSHRILAPQDVTKTWAEMVGFPLPLGEHLTQARVAQVYSVQESEKKAKEHYLQSLKDMLMGRAQAHPDEVDPGLVTRLGRDYRSRTFSELAFRLGYPRYDQEQQDPLRLLAELPVHTYITTSHHDFIEVALRRAGKEPRTEICRWHKGLEGIPSVFEDDYQPTKEEPLVYHLHGSNAYPGSLVLTEDDHMEFLVAISQNIGRDTDPIPRRVRQAMADSSLVLLGYTLCNWDFRVLFWGLIKPRPLHQTSVSVQLEPGELERNYLQKYLSEFEFQIYWGDVYQYAQELRQALVE